MIKFGPVTAPGLVAVALVCCGCAPDPELGEAVYAVSGPRCEAGTRTGRAGITNGESTRERIKYNVRTPSNYDPTIAHPLLMVYAPAGKSPAGTEQFTNFTPEATAAGFIVAYADHRSSQTSDIVELSTIPGLVAQTWCVDEKRIFLTGHSDGGSVAMGMAFIPGTKDIPAAIAPSAVGISKRDLRDRSCPDPIPVMVMHSANDRLFPGYGAGTALWWAGCNGCDLSVTQPLANGCRAFPGCADGAQTWYCENELPHAQWPGMNSSILEFFTNVKKDH